MKSTFHEEPDSEDSERRIMTSDTRRGSESSKDYESLEANGDDGFLDLDTLFDFLPSCSSKEKIDDFIKLFISYGTFDAKEKLINTLCDVESLTLDIIPLYAHLVASLDTVLPEITHSVINFLKRELKYHIEKKANLKEDLWPKLKILKYVVALIELGIFFDEKTLDDFKSFLVIYKGNWSDFYSKNIDRLIKLASSIIMRYTEMVESNYRETEHPHFKFKSISKLIFKDMLVEGEELKIVRIIQCLDWCDPKLFDFAVKCLASSWKVKYSNLKKFAFLVTELSSNFENVGAAVANAVLIKIHSDADLNSSNYKRRLSMIKYLGELHNFGLIESLTIFDTLYYLTMSGFNPKILALMPSDPPRSLIRVRLVLLLIKTTGDFLTVKDNTKIARFLTYFQHYYWLKKSSPIWGTETSSFSFPKGIHNSFIKCIEKYRPDVELCNSYQEATAALDALKKKIIPETDPKNDPNHSTYFPGYGMHRVRYEGDDISD